MPKIYEIASGEKGPGNIINETVLSEGGVTTDATPAFTDSRNLATSTNTAPTVRRFKRKTTGTPAAGIGAGIDFEVQTGAANHEIGAVIQAVTTDVTAASEDFDLVLKTMAAGAAASESMRITSTGSVLAAAETLAMSASSSTARYIGQLKYDGTNLKALAASPSYIRYTVQNLDLFAGAGGISLGDTVTPGTPQIGISNSTGITFNNVSYSAAAHQFVSSGVLRWSLGAIYNTSDTGLSRNAAGVVEVNNGTAGTFRDVIYRNRATGAAAPTIASAGTIAPTVAITFISGTAAIATITAPSPISTGGGTITLIPTGIFTWTTAGNIALAGTAVVGKALTMTYDTTTTKWYPSYIA